MQIVYLITFCAFSLFNVIEAKSFDTVYGELIIDDPLVLEIIESQPFQRLKSIHQYGFTAKLVPTESYTRYEHSLGVYAILKMFGAPREEQIAGLLHDISHTVFSHAADYVFPQKSEFRAYQDENHFWFLEKSGIKEILEKHHYTLNDVHHENRAFQALKCPLPFLSADRIDYNLQGGLLRGLISQEELDDVLRNLHLINGSWLLTSEKAALTIAKASLIMTETLWGSLWESVINRIGAKAIHRAFETGLISHEEFHFSTDDLIWQKLQNSDDEIIAFLIHKMNNAENFYKIVETNEDLIIKEKFRGLDPLILSNGQIFKLSDINPAFAALFFNLKNRMQIGIPIKWTEAKLAIAH